MNSLIYSSSQLRLVKIFIMLFALCWMTGATRAQTIPLPTANSFNSQLSQDAVLTQPSYYDYAWVFNQVVAHASPKPYPAAYECVDYCDRWLEQWYGSAVKNAINGNAQRWMLNTSGGPDTAPAINAGLSTFYNGGYDRPQKGDIVVFEGTDGIGHVAVLKEYKPAWVGWDGEPGYAILAQQNVTQGNDDYHFRVKCYESSGVTIQVFKIS